MVGTLATALAQRNLDALDTFPSPKLIQLQQSAREEPLLKAVGDIDIPAAISEAIPLQMEKMLSMMSMPYPTKALAATNRIR